MHTCTVKYGMCCPKSQWCPSKPVLLLLTCLNHHMSKHNITAPMMPKMARNRSALHDVLAHGASNRDTTVCACVSVFIAFLTSFVFNTLQSTTIFIMTIHSYQKIRLLSLIVYHLARVHQRERSIIACICEYHVFSESKLVGWSLRGTDTFRYCPNPYLPYMDGSDYRQFSNIRRTLVGDKIADNLDVVGALPVGAAPNKFSFST